MNEADDSGAASVERRADARVQDAVGLRLWRLRGASPAEKGGGDDEGVRRVRRANKYDIEGYATVRREHPEVAAYIDELEERIRQLLLDADPIESTPSRKVSLSLGGMAFADERLLHPGELLGITLTLFPSGRRIAGDARVVSANDAPEIAHGDRPTYRVRFVRMSDPDRQALGEHVARLSGARAFGEG